MIKFENNRYYLRLINQNRNTMNNILSFLKNIISENCITIILNTHRTKPENQKDALVLKNLIKETENRLFETLDKRQAQQLITRLNDLEKTIDHSLNQESLVLFVNDSVAEFVRLPISVEDRVIIDNTFATRDLIRAIHLQTSYYVLVLSQQKVRLLEAFNDQLIMEINEPFPIENTHLYSTDKKEIANATKQSNLIAEFFNRVDKALLEVRKNKPLPVLICSEQGNFHEYLKISDQKQIFYDTYLNKNRLDEKGNLIIAEAWKIVKDFTIEKNNARKQDLEKAVNQGKFLSDINDIWKAVNEGRIETLFIEEGLFQPGIIKENEILIVKEDLKNLTVVVDDIYDEMIEANMNFGGDVVFLPKGSLNNFNGFGATTRY